VDFKQVRGILLRELCVMGDSYVRVLFDPDGKEMIVSRITTVIINKYMSADPTAANP